MSKKLFRVARFVGMPLLNILGMVGYLGFASLCWIEPELAHEPGASGGDAIVWGLTAFPILVAFVVIDGVWLVLETFVFLWNKAWNPSAFQYVFSAVVVALMWMVAVYVDYSHHGM